VRATLGSEKQSLGGKEMPETAMACPFSRKACTECAVYRGRHFYLCFKKAFRACEWDMAKYCRVKFRKPHGKNDNAFMIPEDFTISPTVISDIEELIEEKEFSRLKEKGEKHDT
jgi:hypothetical protein